MRIEDPYQARDQSLYHDQQQNNSDVLAELLPEIWPPLVQKPSPLGADVSSFNLFDGGDGQSLLPSGFEGPRSSPRVTCMTFPEQQSVLPGGCSQSTQLPSSVATEEKPSSFQPDRNAASLGTNAMNQVSQPFQTIQTHNAIQNGYQYDYVTQFPIQRRLEAINSRADQDNVPTEAPLHGNGLGSSFEIACPLQGINSNLQPSSQAAVETGLSPIFENNSGAQQNHCELAQPSSIPEIAGSATIGPNVSQYPTLGLLEGNGFKSSEDLNHLQLRQTPEGDKFSALNRTQNVVQLPQISQSRYLFRPGQIYERVSQQTHPPFSSSASLYGHTGMQQTSNRTPVSGLPPFSHSTSSHRWMPIQPATGPTTSTPGTAAAVANGKSRGYDCGVCGKSFKCTKDLHRHIKRMHIQKGRHPCPDAGCNQSFAEGHKLKRHFSTVHLKIRPFKCSACASTFGERGNMIQHFRKAHSGEGSMPKRMKRS